MTIGRSDHSIQKEESILDFYLKHDPDALELLRPDCGIFESITKDKHSFFEPLRRMFRMEE